MTLREQRRKIRYYLTKSSKPFFKRVEIVTSLELMRKGSFPQRCHSYNFKYEARGNQSHCSNFSCFPEYRHIQGPVPILMPSGKASCTNCSDEAVGSQSFNAQLQASHQYTCERMTLDMAFKEDKCIKPICLAKTTSLYKYSQLILTDSSEEVSHTLSRYVTFHWLWERKVSPP